MENIAWGSTSLSCGDNVGGERLIQGFYLVSGWFATDRR
jgi:hypothetical protein